MQPYVSLTSILLSITLPAVNGQQSGCDGQWSDWSDWSGCSFIFLPLVGYKMRIRTCTPSSAECVSPFYACQGNNFEVNECESDDTPIVTNNVLTSIETQTTEDDEYLYTTELQSTTPATESVCMSCNKLTVSPIQDVSRLDASSTIVDNVVDGCLQQLLTCYLNNSSQTVHIQSPSGTMFAEGNGTATANFTCTNSGQWTASVGISVTDVTCSTLKSNCALCDPLQVGLVVADKLQSGRVQMQSTPLSNGCVLINISCTNDLETGGSSIISSNLQVLSNGNKTAEVSLRCNSDRQWQTDDGLTAPYIFCAIPKLAIALPSINDQTDINSSGAENILATTDSNACATTAWSQWSAWTDCTRTCGACGVRSRTRECNSETEACVCTGNGTETEVCGLKPCLFPVERACCEPYTLGSMNGELICKIST